MAEVIESSPERLVCRAERGTVWAGRLFAVLGAGVALGLIRGEELGSGLLDRLLAVPIGLFMVWIGLALAGPEDLIVDLVQRRYRYRSGLLFLARWQEGPLSDFAALALAKRRRSTAWLIRLSWAVPRRKPFEMESISDTGQEATDPRQLALWTMQEYARLLGIPAEGDTVAPPPPPGAPPAPALPRAAPPRQPTVEVKTLRYRLSGSGGRLSLSKRRLFILEDNWQMVFWAALAGPMVGYVLWWRGALWKTLGALPSMLKDTGLTNGRLPADATERGTVVLTLFAIAVVVLFSAVALYAWLLLLRSAARVAAGEEVVFDLPADRITYNGRFLGRISDLDSIQVRELMGARRSARRTWFNLIAVLRDGARLTLAYDGNREELQLLAKGAGGFLGIEPLFN